DVKARLAALAKQREKADASKLPPVSAMDITPIPSFLENHAQPTSVMPWTIHAKATTAGYAWKNLRLAFVSAFESDGRLFYLTTEHLVVPADRVRAARLAEFKGVQLAKPGENGPHLPMVWVRWRPARVFTLHDNTVTPTEEYLQFQAHWECAAKDV